ncbi:hypothetical protein ACIRYZ_41015 [Kitasatospora sp. NPDC101155]|uniref:hypothetical protein n=1 Tax=Kitasatospora sp. NPDC101155 TaxID=3364097 RepID=UPI00380BA770
MSVFTAIHVPVPLARPRTGLRAALAGVIRRLAASPLDHPVLHAVAAQAPAAEPVRMRSRRHGVTAPEGTRRHAHRRPSTQRAPGDNR